MGISGWKDCCLCQRTSDPNPTHYVVDLTSKAPGGDLTVYISFRSTSAEDEVLSMSINHILVGWQAS